MLKKLVHVEVAEYNNYWSLKFFDLLVLVVSIPNIIWMCLLSELDAVLTDYLQFDLVA